jgi:hypothetical protein
MSTFAFILDRGYEGVMALELGCSFLGSFFNSFSRTSLSLGFSSNPTSKLAPPTSLKGPNLFTKAAMWRAMLQEISTTCSSSLTNLYSTASRGCYEWTHPPWLGFCNFLLKPIPGSCNFSHVARDINDLLF